MDDYSLDVLMSLLVRHNNYQANDNDKEGCEERLQQQDNFIIILLDCFTE